MALKSFFFWMNCQCFQIGKTSSSKGYGTKYQARDRLWRSWVLLFLPCSFFLVDKWKGSEKEMKRWKKRRRVWVRRKLQRDGALDYRKEERNGRWNCDGVRVPPKRMFLEKTPNLTAEAENGTDALTWPRKERINVSKDVGVVVGKLKATVFKKPPWWSGKEYTESNERKVTPKRYTYLSQAFSFLITLLNMELDKMKMFELKCILLNHNGKEYFLKSIYMCV